MVTFFSYNPTFFCYMEKSSTDLMHDANTCEQIKIIIDNAMLCVILLRVSKRVVHRNKAVLPACTVSNVSINISQLEQGAIIDM